MDRAHHVQPDHRRGAVRVRLHPGAADPDRRPGGLVWIRFIRFPPILGPRAAARARALLHEAEVRRSGSTTIAAAAIRPRRQRGAAAQDARHIEIRRFGVGHRRPDGPPGTSGVSGQVIHCDGRGHVSELAFARGAPIEPHANPNTTLVHRRRGRRLGRGRGGADPDRGRRGRALAGRWPHAAWTEHSEMRAFVVEFGGGDDGAAAGVLEGRASRSERARRAGPAGRRSPHRGHDADTADPDAGEPA